MISGVKVGGGSITVDSQGRASANGDVLAKMRLKRSALAQAPLQIKAKTRGSLSRARRATADARRGDGGVGLGGGR